MPTSTSTSSDGAPRSAITSPISATDLRPPSLRSSTLSAVSVQPNPLDILLDRLPRLLAVSLTLSARFEHDPSPLGVARAFAGMEDELKLEMAAWAGEVGGLVSLGLGGVIDRTPGVTPAASRRGSLTRLSEDEGLITGVGTVGDAEGEADPDDRLGFSDIVSYASRVKFYSC